MLLSGQFTEFTTDQTMMENALDYFCGLTEERKQEFINCPQVSVEAENFFSLAKAVSCERKDDLLEYISGCNFVCQGIKAQAFVNVKSSEEASETFYTEEEESCDDEINKYTTTAEIMTQLSDTFATYKETQMGNDPEAVKTAFDAQIDAKTGLTEDEKDVLKAKVASTLDSKADFDDQSYNDIQSSLKAEIVSATSAVNVASNNKATATTKKNSLKEMYTTTKT